MSMTFQSMSGSVLSWAWARVTGTTCLLSGLVVAADCGAEGGGALLGGLAGPAGEVGAATARLGHGAEVGVAVSRGLDRGVELGSEVAGGRVEVADGLGERPAVEQGVRLGLQCGGSGVDGELDLTGAELLLQMPDPAGLRLDLLGQLGRVGRGGVRDQTEGLGELLREVRGGGVGRGLLGDAGLGGLVADRGQLLLQAGDRRRLVVARASCGRAGRPAGSGGGVGVWLVGGVWLPPSCPVSPVPPAPSPSPLPPAIG
ncbi:hypothetical protein ACFQ0M_17230 [Kitasatospora aburaviensis]